MLIVKDYFKNRLSGFGIELSDATLESFYQSKEIDPNGEITDIKSVDILCTEIVLMLLVRPKIQEGDMSISYNSESLKLWYNAECKRLGIPNLLEEDKPKVRDMSYLS